MEDNVEVSPELEAAAELYFSQFEVRERIKVRQAQVEAKYQEYLVAQRQVNRLFEEVLELKRLEMLERKKLQEYVPRNHSPDQAA